MKKRKKWASKIKDKFDKFSVDSAYKSVKMKYKALEMFDKTKEKLSSIEEDEEESLYMSEDDIAELQKDLASLTADIKEEKPKEKKIEWEEIKTYDSFQKEKENIVEEIVPSILEYWCLNFSAVFRFFLRKYEFKQVLFSFNNHNSVKIPLLARLYKKVKDSQFNDQIIIFLSEERED